MGRQPENLLADIAAAVPNEIFKTLLSAGHVRIEKIVSQGHVSPDGFWYDQPENEWVLLIQGAARLRFEGQDVLDLIPGSFVNIPAHQRHRVDWSSPTGPTIWLAIHYL